MITDYKEIQWIINNLRNRYTKGNIHSIELEYVINDFELSGDPGSSPFAIMKAD